MGQIKIGIYTIILFFQILKKLQYQSCTSWKDNDPLITAKKKEKIVIYFTWLTNGIFLVFLILIDINSFSLVTGMVSYANL